MNNTEQTDKGQLGEDFVNKIAFNSFLKYWCFPSPLDIIGDNKEICDLLIVFDTVCLIVSVKNYSFHGNYKRYFNKTLVKANRQLIGAEKKLFGTNTILLKHPDRNAEVFPKESIKNIYRIIVNLNMSVKYYRTSYSFENKPITIMDAHAWHASISELNTLPDFINYIESRFSLFNKFPAYILPREEFDFSKNDEKYLFSEIDEEIATKGKITLVSGNELDLIATYIKHGYKFSPSMNHDKIAALIMKIDGEWHKFQESKLNKSKQDLESEGYFVDQLVKEMLIDKEDGEKLSKMFFKLNRLERSGFAKEFLKFHKELVVSKEKIRFNRTNIIFNGMHMVFVYYVDNYPTEELNLFVKLSLIHHAYLNDFKCGKIGLLGASKSLSSFQFGFLEDIKEKKKHDVGELTKTFEKLGWKTKNEDKNN